MTDEPDATPPLSHYLERAYFHGVGVGNVRDPAPACAAGGFDRAELQARLSELNAVRERCVVSRVRADFLNRVLALMPDAPPTGPAGAAPG
jgi:hypothetical protein